jgi:hypothetical protein
MKKPPAADWAFRTGAFNIQLSMVFMINAYKIFTGYSQWNRPLERPKNILIN